MQTAALILGITSTLPLVICLIKMRQLKKYKAKATIITALVTAAEKRKGQKNATYYLLDIQYKALTTGELYIGKAISWKRYATGDSMPLMYVTDDPANFKTDFGRSLQWLLPISIIIIALVAWLCYWLLTQQYYYSTS